MPATLRHTYRLRPGRKALEELGREWNGCRWLWNRAVEAKRKRQEWLKDKDLTCVRAELPWLAAGSVVAQQQTLRTFRQSRRARRFKSARRDLPSLNYTKRGFSLQAGRLRLPRKTVIPVVWSRELPSEPSSVRVYRDSLGHWYASFVVQREDAPLEATGRATGIDWGVKRVATTTSPAYDLPHAEHARKAAAKLARYQRRMARRKPGGRYETLTGKGHRDFLQVVPRRARPCRLRPRALREVRLRHQPRRPHLRRRPSASKHYSAVSPSTSSWAAQTPTCPSRSRQVQRNSYGTRVLLGAVLPCVG